MVIIRFYRFILFTMKYFTGRYNLFLEDYKVGRAWGMAFLAAALGLIGMITTALSRKSD